MGIIFTTLSQLTNGLISDATTLVIGILVLGFIAMGFDMLKGNLDLFLANRRGDAYGEKADFWFQARENSTKGTRNYDEADMFYKASLRESVKNRMAGRGF